MKARRVDVVLRTLEFLQWTLDRVSRLWRSGRARVGGARQSRCTIGRAPARTALPVIAGVIREGPSLCSSTVVVKPDMPGSTSAPHSAGPAITLSALMPADTAIPIGQLTAFTGKTRWSPTWNA